MIRRAARSPGRSRSTTTYPIHRSDGCVWQGPETGTFTRGTNRRVVGRYVGGRNRAFALVALMLLVGCTASRVAEADIPPAGQIWFGDSFNTETFALAGRKTTVGSTAPFSFVAHLTKAVDASQLTIRAFFDGSLVSSVGVNATGTSDLWGLSPGPLFAAGTWRYELLDVGGNVLASGTITAT